jgi:hypothetical protein
MVKIWRSPDGDEALIEVHGSRYYISECDEVFVWQDIARPPQNWVELNAHSCGSELAATTVCTLPAHDEKFAHSDGTITWRNN